MDASILNGESEGDRTGMHGPSPILGPDGQPMRRLPAPSQRKSLSDEIARPQLIGARQLWDTSTVSGLTPERLAVLLRETVRGDIRAFIMLAEEMEERDLHYASVMGTRKRVLSGLKPSITPASEKRVDKKIAEDVRDLIENEALPDLIEDLLDGLGKGFSVCEIMWSTVGGKWTPVAFPWRDQKFFTFDYISRSEVRMAEFGTIDGLELPPGKFIVHTPKLKSGIPIRGGLARLAAWAFLFKSFTLKDWMTFLDVYGMPVRVGKYHPAATADERRSLLRAVAGIATDAAAIIPESMAIEFIEAKGFADKPFETFAKYLDEQVSKAVLGQTSSADDSATVGQARIHDEVRRDIQQADARQLAASLNTYLIGPYVAMNYGENVRAPKIEFPIAEPQDILALSAALQRTVPLGLKVSQEQVREKLGLREPEEGEELLTPPPVAAPGVPSDTDPPAPENQGTTDYSRTSQRFRAEGVFAGPQQCACANCRALAAAGALDDPHNADVDALDASGAADWQRQIGPMKDAISALMKRSKSLAEFEAGLKQLYAGLETSALEAGLATAQMKARGIGEG